MTRLKATANCPSCKWKFFKVFEAEQDPVDLAHSANQEVDVILLDHIKTHDAISQLLQEASKEVPIVRDSHKGFRGSFNLKYEELR